MSKKLGLVVLVVLALLLSGCVQQASSLPTPTAKSNFPQPASTSSGMGIIEQAGTQTAIALNIPLGTPALVITGTVTATPTSPDSLPGVVVPTSTGLVGLVDTALPTLTADPNATATKTSLAPQPTVQTPRPATYTLKEGEFVYCLARRFNVDPDQILSLNGLVDSETIYPGTTLKIPSSGSFPGPRALRAHPATYTVQLNDTIYGIACLYGDVDPLNIAAVNGLAAPYNLTTGAQIKIP